MSKTIKSEQVNRDPTSRLKLQDAIHSLRLEGMEIPEASIPDLLLFEEGKLSEKEVIARFLAKSKHQ